MQIQCVSSLGFWSMFVAIPSLQQSLQDYSLVLQLAWILVLEASSRKKKVRTLEVQSSSRSKPYRQECSTSCRECGSAQSWINRCIPSVLGAIKHAEGTLVLIMVFRPMKDVKQTAPATFHRPHRMDLIMSKEESSKSRGLSKDCHALSKDCHALSGKNSSVKPWIVMSSTSEKLEAYDLSCKDWHTVPIPFDAPQYCVVASAGGLLCFAHEWFTCNYVVVLNPLTQEWRKLPPMRQLNSIQAVGMTHDPTSNSFQIFLYGDIINPFSHRLAVEKFDSRSNRWTVQDTPPKGGNYVGRGHMQFYKGYFFCLTATPPYLLLAYDLKHNMWVDLNIKMPPKNPIAPSLYEWQGRLFLMGGIQMRCDNSKTQETQIRIWELDYAKQEWAVTACMPKEEYCRPFLSLMVLPPSKALFSFGSGDFIFFTIRGSDGSLPAVLYNISQKTWQWWPLCRPQRLEICRDDVQLLEEDNFQFRGISFEPNVCSHVI